MVMNCAVLGCRSISSVDKVGYFTVPAVITRQDDLIKEISSRRRHLWISRLGLNIDEKKVNSNTRVCGKHFIDGRPARLRDVESVDWVPSIGVHFDPDEMSDPLVGNGLQHEEQILLKNEVPSPLFWNVDVQMIDDPLNDRECEATLTHCDKSCQTDIESDNLIDKDVQNQIIAHNMALREENLRLKVRVCEFSEEQLSGDDLKVKFYTGFNTFVDLKYVYEIIVGKVKYYSFHSLSKFQEFLIVMIRLRLNLLEQDTAFRFGVSQGTIRNIINRWLPVMSNTLSNLIHWPERVISNETMPSCFKAAFGNKIVLIVDFLEVLVEAPSLRSGTMLSNENYSPKKFLIVILPQGSILSVYKISAAQQSESIIREGKVFENLIPGDIVLCANGLTIDASVGMYQAKFSTQVFSKGQSQTPSEEMQVMREFDNLKIHVDNVLSLLKQEFKILQSPIPSDYLCPNGQDTQCPIDYIVTICCALVNFPTAVFPLKSEPNGDN